MSVVTRFDGLMFMVGDGLLLNKNAESGDADDVELI
jgi:hypothetical protein